MNTLVTTVLPTAIAAALLAWSPVRAGTPPVDPQIEREVVTSYGFEQGHPDMKYRRLGAEARERGEPEQAREHFRRASYYADKISQAAYSEMLWKGEGGEADRPLAYAWMDLAAQRGTPSLVGVRERYWSELDAGEREQAVSRGEAIYAEYGDAVAKPRQEREMRRVRMGQTGSRVGGKGALDVCKGPARTNAPGGSCGEPFSRGEYYADRYWEPAAYWRWQEALLEAAHRKAITDAGPPQQLRD